jgi:hypothetical protein
LSISKIIVARERKARRAQSHFWVLALNTPNRMVAMAALNVTLTVLNGDYQSVINAIKEQGGAFYPDPNDSGTYWLLPWPPAAIRISHEPSANQLAYAEIGHEVSINENVPRQTEELSK